MVISYRLVVLWQRGAIGDWQIFLVGLVAVIIVAVFITMMVTYRRDQL